MDIRETVRRQQAEIRRDFAALRKLYPSAFDTRGKPIVAVLLLPATSKGGAAPITKQEE